MGNLNEKEQARLDQWRKNTLQNISLKKAQEAGMFRTAGKRDYGDVNSLEELEEEHKRSQRRR